MFEIDYCKSIFNDNFTNIRKKRIALYGSGEEAREILKNFPEYNFVCVVDEENAGKYLEELLVISFDTMLELEVEYLIIAAPTVIAESMYRHIMSKCRMSSLKVFNLYGKDMYILHKDISEKNVDYVKSDEKRLMTQIDNHEVIAFDVDNTIFTVKRIDKFDFYQQLEKKLISEGINIEFFADKYLKKQSADSCKSFKSLMREIMESEQIAEEYTEQVWNIVLEVMQENFITRTSVLNALKYSLEQGKTVYLIEDMAEYRIPSELWLRLAEKNGAKGIKKVICSSEYFEDKYQGLFREITEDYPNATYLYVGDELEADILVPQLYGIDTFLVKSPRILFKEIEAFRPEMLQNRAVREAYENYMLEVYNDELGLAKITEKRCASERKLDALKRKIDFCKNCGEEVYDDTAVYTPVLLKEEPWNSDPEGHEKFKIPQFDNPTVSIIIPVYNQFEYTYNCVKAILNNTSDVAYEVIVADDCSIDLTWQLENIISGITVLHNKENLKFLKNCNNAAKYAKGEFIVFLNNDTQVQPNWLLPLVEIMRNDKEAGMVGSKLVYPNGCLQEAGGILWKDGSAWNYGHGKNPTNAEFSYVKEADYISGAAIMIRTSLWNEIGGFDERFAPAYYEDTDLAFEVRKHGYKVLLQPESVVVHFEGVSNGTDVSTGLKTYQVVNQKKFYQKWKDVLGGEHFENGTNVYLAKDRGQTKKQILVVDHYVPNYDKDAGGRCTFMYIKAFLKLGMKVTFIGDNFAKPEPYTSILTQMGVEVLYGGYYYVNRDEWLKDNLKYFDYIYLQRPHISIKYMDLVKEYGRGKIFYFAHDLHHVRMYRDYLVTGNEESLKESEYWKKIEMELFEKTDVGHVVGSYEQEVMQKAFPDKPIRNIPLYIYDTMPENIEKDFTKRKDILFVGGFKHVPNVDAVLWFAKEIYPNLLKKYPDMVWHIVGSSAPEEICELASENIVLEGFVTDEELAELYQKCRLVVVPLRYGAGVKGKIVEAAYYQIPVVTTSVGGEGIDSKIGAFIMEDEAERMTEVIDSLYENYEELRKMSDAGYQLTQKYFTTEATQNVLLSDINITCKRV